MFAPCAYGAVVSLLLYAGPALASPGPDCPGILSNLERLACFDQAAGTPVRLPPLAWSAPEQDAPTLRRVMANEARRAPDDLTFRIGVEDPGASGHGRLLISAPAIATAEPHAYLAIGCVQNISRLQLITAQPIEARWVKVQLQGEGGSTRMTRWQVMENGQVLDAGRGLPAIEQIKQVRGAQRIQVVSDHPAVSGLTFDAQGLGPLIDQARKACRW